MMEIAGADGRRFPLQDQGEGSAILLVHGGSNGSEDWDRVAAHLSRRFRTLRYRRFTYRVHPLPPARRLMACEKQDVLAIAHSVSRASIRAGNV